MAVSSLQDDIAVSGTEITGTLKYAASFTGFSDDTDLQEGNFLALSVTTDPTGGTIDVDTDDETKIDSENNIIVIRVTDETAPIVVKASYTNGVTVSKEYDISGLTLEPAPENAPPEG